MSEPDETVTSESNETPTPEQIERELLLPAPPEDVWNAVTSSGWLAPEVRLDLVPGGEASFSGEEWSKTGWIEESIPPEDGSAAKLVFWWSTDGEPATRVEVTLEAEDPGFTRLRVVEARPLELLDVTGIPYCGGSQHGPLMLALA